MAQPQGIHQGKDVILRGDADQQADIIGGDGACIIDPGSQFLQLLVEQTQVGAHTGDQERHSIAPDLGAFLLGALGEPGRQLRFAQRRELSDITAGRATDGELEDGIIALQRPILNKDQPRRGRELREIPGQLLGIFGLGGGTFSWPCFLFEIEALQEILHDDHAPISQKRESIAGVDQVFPA